MADVVVLVITRRCKRAPRFGVGERWHVLGQAGTEERLLRLVGSFPEAMLVLGEATENLCVGG